MELQDIAHISGKSGLHRILKPTRSGVIVESLDEKKAKQVVGTQNRVSVLKEISIYTTDKDGSVPLEKVLELIFEKYNVSIPVNTESSSTDQSKFLESILPNFDKSRVYNSDIKRLVTWYGLLVKNAPELFEKKPEEILKVEGPALIEEPIQEDVKAENEKPVTTKKEEIVKKAATEIEAIKDGTEKAPVKKTKKEKIAEVPIVVQEEKVIEEKPKATRKKKGE